jgi:hypothetical protein
MRRVFARSLLVAVSALAACAGSPAVRKAAATPAPSDYFPLAVGNSWTFLDHSPQQAQPSHHTIRIIRRDPDGYFIDDQHGALRADADCLHDRARRLLCRPIEPGASWTSVVSSSVTERYRVAAVGETVTVPAGTFQNCVRVRSQAFAAGVEQVAELTYAPGVGLVKLETFAVVKGAAASQVRGELESYRLVHPAK